MSPEELVRRFYEAFNAQDLNAVETLFHPQAEIDSARGPRYGRQGVREWATRTPGGELEQRLALDGVRVNGDRAVALVRRQWWWRESEELAEEEELGSLFEFRNGLIARLVPGRDRASMLAAAGIEI